MWRLTGQITESGVGKLSHAGLTLLNVIDSSTKGFLEILSNVLVAQERSLSFTYGRLDKSCSSFTLMYFGKRRTSQINLFWAIEFCWWSCPILLWLKGSHFWKLARHLVCKFVIWWTGWVTFFCWLKVWFGDTWCCSAQDFLKMFLEIEFGVQSET